MALLHGLSEECLKSELDLFTVPMTQTAIEKNAYVEIAPISALCRIQLLWSFSSQGM